MPLTVKRAVAVGIVLSLVGPLPASLAKDAVLPAGKPAIKAQPRTKRTKAPDTIAPSGSQSVPMDFSGMDKSVKDLRNPSNARSNGQFNGDGGTGSSGFSPGATFKF